jgi:hypothetical protein
MERCLACEAEGLIRGCIVLVPVVVLVLDTAYFSQRFRRPDGVNLREDASVRDNRSCYRWPFPRKNLQTNFRLMRLSDEALFPIVGYT